jgi:hypothetical protein
MDKIRASYQKVLEIFDRVSMHHQHVIKQLDTLCQWNQVILVFDQVDSIAKLHLHKEPLHHYISKTLQRIQRQDKESILPFKSTLESKS